MIKNNIESQADKAVSLAAGDTVVSVCCAPFDGGPWSSARAHRGHGAR